MVPSALENQASQSVNENGAACELIVTGSSVLAGAGAPPPAIVARVVSPVAAAPASTAMPTRGWGFRLVPTLPHGAPPPPGNSGRLSKPGGPSFSQVTCVAPLTSSSGPLPEQSHRLWAMAGISKDVLWKLTSVPASIAVSPGGSVSVTVTGPWLAPAPTLNTFTAIVPLPPGRRAGG